MPKFSKFEDGKSCRLVYKNSFNVHIELQHLCCDMLRVRKISGLIKLVFFFLIFFYRADYCLTNHSYPVSQDRIIHR